MLNLQELVGAYHSSAASLPGLTPWFQLVTDGLVINHDGSLLACFEYEGLDFDSTEEDELDAASLSLERAFSAFDHRNQLWTFLDKRRHVFVKDSDISNPVAKQLERDWLAYVDDGSLASIRHFLFVSFQPFRGASGFFDEVGAVMTESGTNLGSAIAAVLKGKLLMRAGIQKVEGKLESGIHSFENQLMAFLQVLPRMNLRRVKGNEFLAELSNRINLASPRSKVSVPNPPYYLNTLLATDTVRRVDGGLLRFDGAQRHRLCSMMSLKGYPGQVTNVDAEHMLHIHGDFSVVHTFRFLDREEAKSYVMKSEQHYRSQVKSPITQIVEKMTGEPSERVDSGQLVLAEDAQAALVEITAEGVDFGYHSMSVQVLGATMDELNHTRKELAGMLSNAGYGVVNEVIHQVGAFMATIPGGGQASVRSTLVSTRNLADMALVRSIRPGPAKNKHLTEQRQKPSGSLCLFPTPSGVPERFNFHVGDVGHFMVVGPNGAGKTSLVNLSLAMWQRYSPCRVIVLDKNLSCWLTIKALGGSYVTLTDDRSAAGSKMNPLRWIKQPARRGDVTRWLCTALTAFPGADLTARDFEAVTSALSTMAESGSGNYSLSDFKSFLAGDNADLAARLLPWLRQSAQDGSANYGHIFDNKEDAFSQQLKMGASGIVGIDVGGLLKDDRLAPSVLEYLFMSIEDLVDGRTPTLIYLEEAWYLLSNPRFRAGFEEWIKTMRKRMAIVGLSTQSVEDIKRSGISSTLNDNIKTRIMLPNSQAQASRDVYVDMLGLTDRHVNIIREMVPKKHYMIWQEGRTRILDGFLPPSVLALTRSDALARDVFSRHFVEGDDSSVARYIKEIAHAST